MEHADVEHAGSGRGVADGEVVGRGLVSEAPAVEGDAERLDSEGLRRTTAEPVDVAGPGQALGDDGRGVVVPLQNIDRDPRLLEPTHLACQVEAGPHVPPVAVEQVAGDDDEVDRSPAREVYHVVERAPGRRTDVVDRKPLVARQTRQRTVEVNVGYVQKAKVGHPSFNLFWLRATWQGKEAQEPPT